jgi:6-phosphogluconolactonase
LRNTPVDWNHVHIYFGDERCLPRGDARRNDSMAHEELLAHVAIPRDQVHPINAERGAAIASAEYAALLTRVLPLDLVLLGLGDDGHTASLFPGNAATEQGDVVVPVFNAPRPPPERVSLSLGTLNAARKKIFLVAGKEKREALTRIVRGIALPAARITGAEWHVDRAALPEENMT